MARNQKSNERKPTERELNQRQALKNAEAARASHRSQIPGVPDDSEVIQATAAALAAPIEGAHDALREDERARVESKTGTRADEVAGPRAADAPNVTATGKKRDKTPDRAEDAEWDPLAATAEHRSPKRK